MRVRGKHIRELIRPARKDWVVVGDASRVVIYEKKKGQPFRLVKTFANEMGHQKISELAQDRQGRCFDSFTKSRGSHQTGTPRHAYTSHQNPKEHAVETFLRQTSGFLDNAHGKRAFDRLILIANSRLLGRLRSLISSTTQGTIQAEHTKDFAWLAGDELQSRVETLITPLFRFQKEIR